MTPCKVSVAVGVLSPKHDLLACGENCRILGLTLQREVQVKITYAKVTCFSTFTA